MRARVNACADETRHALTERRLRQYAPAVQGAVRDIAYRHPRVADLAVSFPALLFALTVPRRGQDVDAAITAAINGQPLADVARIAGVPMWLRKLPIENLERATPRLPDGDLLRRRIVNHLPRSPKIVPRWLDAVASAAAWSHEPFAVWIARELARGTKGFKPSRLPLLSLWSWFSIHPGTVGHQIIERPWLPAMHLKTALEAVDEWRMRVTLHVNLGEAPLADPWLTPGCVYNYEFVPLRGADDIVAEAAAMKNCLNSYGYNVAHNRSRLWSVRMNGGRVATLRLAQYLSDPLIVIRELKGERNQDVSVEVWWAARQWLHQHDLPAIDTKWRVWGEAPLDPNAWRSLWRPYWLAKRRLPAWLPLAPSRKALEAL